MEAYTPLGASMEVKDLMAVALLFFTVPACVLIATISQRARDVAFFVVVAGAVVTDRFDVNFLSQYWYRGTTRGLEFSIVDLAAISIFFSSLLLPRRGESRFYWPSSLGLMLIFFVYSGISVMLSTPKIYGVFELSKMVRGLICFLGVALYVRSDRELKILVLALCCAVCFEGLLAVKQRVLGGIHRVPGSLEHENSLSMYLCLVAPIFVAAANASFPKFLRIFSIIALCAAAVCSVLTISRAGVPTFALVVLSTTVLCVSWRVTLKKMIVTAVVALGIVGMAFSALDSLKERYAEASFEDEYLDDQQEGRGYYLRVAKVIVEDKFFGVGLNNWSYWVSKKYGAMVGRPYDDYDGLQDAEPDDDAVAGYIWAAPSHNLAALTIGELGVPGLALMGLLWLRWFQMGGRFLFRRNPEPMHRLGAGIFFGLCGIFLHSLTEWVFRQTHIFLTFNVLIGTLASLYYAKRHARKPVVTKKVVYQSVDSNEFAGAFSTRA
jgi:hypothetical protein